MSKSLGDRLRAQREAQNMTLATIAAQTKIQLALLEGLERDDVSHWPAGIFRRAFLRAYARAIGLEPEVIVREFLERYPDPIDGPAADLPIASGGAEVSANLAAPPTRLRYCCDSARHAAARLRAWILRRRMPAQDAQPDDVRTPLTPPSRSSELDLLAAGRVCTALGRVDQPSALAPLLRETAGILDVIGVVVWIWEPRVNGLTAVLACGYSDQVVAQLPSVPRDANNATAEAFRNAETCVVNGTDRSSGALAVPLMTPKGCVGVLAIEVWHGREQEASVLALATIFAAQLARVPTLLSREPVTAATTRSDTRHGRPRERASRLSDVPARVGVASVTRMTNPPKPRHH
jgi:transcriptional regulator with XRE-family HTH domain